MKTVEIKKRLKRLTSSGGVGTLIEGVFDVGKASAKERGLNAESGVASDSGFFRAVCGFSCWFGVLRKNLRFEDREDLKALKRLRAAAGGVGTLIEGVFDVGKASAKERGLNAESGVASDSGFFSRRFGGVGLEGEKFEV